MQELRALVDAYAVAADERDAGAFGDVFHDDAWLEVGGSRYEGRAAIATITERLARFDSTLHLVSTHRCRAVGDDRASGVAYCEAHHRTGETDRVLFIRYDDDYARGADGRWRIAARTVHVLWEEVR